MDACLSVGLGHTLQLVLLLDCVAVGGTLGSVDDLVRETLSDGLDVPEGSLPSSSAEQPDRLVNPPKRRHINSLTPDRSRSSDTGRVLAGTRVDDGVHNNLEGVLASEEMDDLESVLHNPHGHQLLAIVPAVHHERVAKPLDNGALSLAEPLGCVSSSRVGHVAGVLLLHCNVILERHVRDRDILTAPLAEKHDLWKLWKSRSELQLRGGSLRNLISPIVGHF